MLMSATRDKPCSNCPNNWCLRCPNRKLLLGFRHKIYLKPEKHLVFQTDLSNYKQREYVELFTFTIDNYYTDYVECTSYQAMKSDTLLRLFPYIAKLELNTPVHG